MNERILLWGFSLFFSVCAIKKGGCAGDISTAKHNTKNMLGFAKNILVFGHMKYATAT
jgi:hypothetical protein